LGAHLVAIEHDLGLRLIVLQIKGWEESAGVDKEIAFARDYGKPIYMSQMLWDKVYDHTI